MICLSGGNLPSHALTLLQKYQRKIDALPDYPSRVGAAKSHFKQYNKSSNKTFRAVRETLETLCCGAVRCMYCEDSCADEVEHFKPKDLYPEACFVWENYLYACGPCNGPKNNKFAVFVPGQARPMEVARAKGVPIVPPQAGDPALIDPRTEDPLDFIHLDLETGFISPAGRKNSRPFHRAEYTIRVLRLNDRPELLQARKGAYHSYLARLEQYAHRKSAGAASKELDRLVAALQRMEHRSVWKEMLRQAPRIPELRQAFESAPEAHNW